MIEYPLLLVFPVAMTCAAAFDLLTMTIPNKISIALMIAFFVVAPLVGLSWSAIGIHATTGAAVLVLGFALFAGGYMGGGDAKLLAAASLWLGHESLLNYFLAIGALGGVLSLAILGLRRIPDAYIPSLDWVQRLHSKSSGIPYGLAIGGAALMLYPHTQWFTALMS